MTIHQQHVPSNCSKIRGPSYAYMVRSYEHEEYGVGSSDTGDTEEEHHNTWNALLEALTMPGSSPAIQQSLQDWEVCRVALSCHFELDILYMSMEWQAGERLLHAQTHCENCVLRYGKLTVRQKVRGTRQGWTRSDWVQVHPGRGHSFA